MFTNEEGEGWQQLGEGLMPQSTREAGAMMDGFGKMGEQSIHSLLGGTSMPEFHNALSAMYSPPPIEIGAAGATPGGTGLPQLDFFDSGSSSSMLSGAESAAAPGGESMMAAPGGGESMMMAPGGESMLAATPTGGESLLSAAFPNSGESLLTQAFPSGGESLLSAASPSGGESLLSAAGPNGGESLLSAAGPSGGESLMSAGGPGGAIETLQTPGAEMMGATPGAESAYFQPAQGAGLESVANVTDASPMANIGKAVTDIMTKMTDMIGGMLQGPMGLLGGLLNFLLTIFTEILSTIGTAMAETARAAASLAAEAWKKHLEMTT